MLCDTIVLGGHHYILHQPNLENDYNTSRMKNVNLIISFLDKCIEHKHVKVLTAVQAGELLDKAGILKDSVSRKGKPLREILRAGLIPHAYQVGTNWFIPLSKQSSLKKIHKSIDLHSCTSKENTIKYDCEVSLMSEKNFRQVATLTGNDIPHAPGLYVIRIKDTNELPIEFNEILHDRNHNIIYIGIAKTSLRNRLWNQELHAKGHGTFFRSLGAMLGYFPEKGSLNNYKNKSNYTFSESDKNKIIQWIEKNLYINFTVLSDNLNKIETDLIETHLPLINIDKNPQKCQLLIQLREVCKTIANSSC